MALPICAEMGIRNPYTFFGSYEKLLEVFEAAIHDERSIPLYKHLCETYPVGSPEPLVPVAVTYLMADLILRNTWNPDVPKSRKTRRPA